MARALCIVLSALVAALVFSSAANAGGGNYVFDGGTSAQRTQVTKALNASSFDWNVVPAQITIHVGEYPVSHATRGHIYVDGGLLDAGRFAWATVQDEYAHQIDFFLFDRATRARLTAELGAQDWCYGVKGLFHAQYGCERFASTLVWSYWPSKHNSYKPTSAADESAAMSPARFKALMASLLPARA